jgi:hypothetical protein
MGTKVESDFNLQRLNTKELSENLKATIQYGGNAVIIGRRGSGKTLISKQAIFEAGFEEAYLNLSVLERPDMGGYPDFAASAKGKSFVDFLLPSFYQNLIEGNKPVVVLLDEVDKAEQSLLAPLLEFTQMHSINGRVLPNLQAVIMTGNLQAEGGQRPSLPLLDRAEKYLIDVHINHWLDWAASKGKIHPSITAYLADNPGDLYGDVDPGDIYADASPRGWDNSSKIISFGEKQKWSPKLLSTKVSGFVGKKIGIKYSAYFDHYQVLLPVVSKIMNGEKVDGFDKLEPSQQMVACMIVCSRLARVLDNTKSSVYPKEANSVIKFFKDSYVDQEMSFIAVRSQIGIDRYLKSSIADNDDWDDYMNNMVKRINHS